MSAHQWHGWPEEPRCERLNLECDRLRLHFRHPHMPAAWKLWMCGAASVALVIVAVWEVLA
jgi:hypothetical protein